MGKWPELLPLRRRSPPRPPPPQDDSDDEFSDGLMSAEAQVFLHDLRTSTNAQARPSHASALDDASLKHRLHIHDLTPVELPERFARSPVRGSSLRGTSDRRGMSSLSRAPTLSSSLSLPGRPVMTGILRPGVVDFSAHRSS